MDNLRLRCRAHNRHTAERELGSAFVKCKRDERRRERADRSSATRAEKDRRLALTAVRAERERIRAMERIAEQARARIAGRMGEGWIGDRARSEPA